MVDRSVSAHRRRLVTLFLVCALAVGGAACGDDDDSASPTTSVPRSSTTSPSDSSTSSAAPTDDAAVRAGYEAASRAFIEAAAIPDPESQPVATTHTGPMFEQTRNLLRALQLDGRFIRYPPESQYRIAVEGVEVDGDVATLTACVVDDGERVDRESGEVIAGGVVTVEWTAAMRRIDGSWRLAERREQGRWDGVAGCATE